ASRSNPECVAKFWSSAAISATGNDGAIASRSRQSCARRKPPCPCTQPSTWRMAIKLENGGSTNRSVATCSTVNSSSHSGSVSSRRSQRRRGRAGAVPGARSTCKACAIACSSLSRWRRAVCALFLRPRLPDKANPMTDTPLPADGDRLTRFLLPGAGVRGVHVQLRQAWQQIRSRDDYPPAAAELLGEAVAAAALFTGHTKVEGRLSVQLRGQHRLRTLFAECTADGTLQIGRASCRERGEIAV